jgi:hypothetical protein
MKLPELPKKYKRIEADVDSKVAEKVAKIHAHRNWALEVKIKGGRLTKNQMTKLKQVENGTMKPYKIPDMGKENPFDFFFLGDADAIVCVVDGKNVSCEVNSGVFKFNFKI